MTAVLTAAKQESIEAFGNANGYGLSCWETVQGGG